MLLRDVNNQPGTLARIAPQHEHTHNGPEKWAMFEKGELLPDTALTGRFAFDTRQADVGAVLESIEDARQEAIIRQQGREAAAESGD
jgi:RIO kinase 1